VSPTVPADVYALLGDPVAGNPTQEMLEAAFAAAGIAAQYVSLTVEPDELEDAVRGARALGFAGFHVTAPHKVAVVPLVDRLTPAAGLAGAVNCVKREGPSWSPTTPTAAASSSRSVRRSTPQAHAPS
jgi:shikimate dehydrogenase